MPFQHVVVTPEKYEALLAAGFTPTRPPIEPFTLKTFNRWVQHPELGMLPMYGSGAVLTAIPTISDPTPSDMLNTRNLTAKAYLIKDDLWLPDVIIPMKMILDTKLQDYIDVESIYNSMILPYQAYVITDLESKIIEFKESRWPGNSQPENYLDLIRLYCDPQNRLPGDEDNNTLNTIWTLKNQVSEWQDSDTFFT